MEQRIGPLPDHRVGPIPIGGGGSCWTSRVTGCHKQEASREGVGRDVHLHGHLSRARGVHGHILNRQLPNGPPLVHVHAEHAIEDPVR
jgi:hypothetical protein